MVTLMTKVILHLFGHVYRMNKNDWVSKLNILQCKVECQWVEQERNVTRKAKELMDTLHITVWFSELPSGENIDPGKHRFCLLK